MHKTIDAIYERGIIKPLEKLPLTESQKIRITIDTTESLVASTRAMIKADPDLVRQVAENDEYLYDT
ncbi:MAG: antitoxin family protein [candidate division NC10 bacterium]|nr:antitoxin family protein [candidate division NC10 bacterium]